jgi:hypothetical protein
MAAIAWFPFNICGHSIRRMATCEHRNYRADIDAESHGLLHTMTPTQDNRPL